MYLGNMWPVTGVDKILNAVEKDELRNVLVVIAGAGTMRKDL